MILALSVIIITKDAEKTIQSCLDSVKWADEIIIFDSGSQDSTLEYCLSYTQKIFLTDWPGFGVQKNRALNEAKGQWVLSIDADESLSDDLIEEIKQIIYHNPQERHDAFEIKRISFFAGKKVRYGDWRNDKVVRLFRRVPPIQFTSSMIHERLKGYRHLGRLKNPMLHKTMETMSHVLMKLEHYSSFGAQVAYQKRKKATLFKAILHALWCFIRGYLLRLGFLDGREGFILATSNASGVFYRYIKLIYLYKTHHAR